MRCIDLILHQLVKMFKTVRWRSEKNKIKAVFKLQFLATQVPELGWDSLMVSLVPPGVGKPTAKSGKAAVHERTCRWENPIYETVRFVREPKTGKINEKTYHFLISTGLSKTSLVGKVTFDFADYAEAIKPSSVSLPLQASNSSIVLHITIQRIQAASDVRGRENGDVTLGRLLETQSSNCNSDGSYHGSNDIDDCNFTEEKTFFATQTKLCLSNAKATPQHSESINLRGSNCSDAISALSLGSSSGQYNSREFGLKSNSIQRDVASFLSSPCSNATPQNPTAVHVRSITEIKEFQGYTVNSAPDGSIPELTNSSGENTFKEKLEDSDVSIEKLKDEMRTMARQVEVLELEVQTLRKQIVKERRKGHELPREVCSFKEQRDELQMECEKLKGLQLNTDGAMVSDQFDAENPAHVLDKIKQQLNYERDLNESLQSQLQKAQESNYELILSLQELEKRLDHRTKETAPGSAMDDNVQGVKMGICCTHLQQPKSNKEGLKVVSMGNSIKHEMEDEEQEALEELVKEYGDTKLANSVEKKIIDLHHEIQMYRRDNEELEMQMEQLALDYEILNQENHVMSSKLEQNRLHEQLRMQYECSVSLSVVNDLEAHIENLEKELQKQAEAFEADLATIVRAKVEQEQKAIQAEEALRKMKWSNTKRAEKLQEEFKGLSAQVSSTFSANEKVAMQALADASEQHLQKKNLEELLDKATEELGLVKDLYEGKVKELENEIDIKAKQTDQLLLELKDMSEELKNQKKSKEEKDKAFSKEILMLQTEKRAHKVENKNLLEQPEQNEKLGVEMKQMKKSFEEMIMLLQKGNMDRDALEEKVASVSREADHSLEELNYIKHLIDEKEKMLGSLQSELAILQTQYTNLKHSLFEDELEKEIKYNDVNVIDADRAMKPPSSNNTSHPFPLVSKDEFCFTEKIKLHDVNAHLVK